MSEDSHNQLKSPDVGLVRFGVRARLLFAIIPSLILSFLVVWWVASSKSRDGINEITNRNLKVTAQSVANEVGGLVDDAHADLFALSKMDIPTAVLDTLDDKNFSWYADELILTKKKYSALLVLDLAGTVVGSNTVGRNGRPLKKPLKNKSLKTTGWFKELQEDPTKPLHIDAHQALFLDTTQPGGERAFGFVNPVFDILDDEPIGYVALFVSIPFIDTRLNPHLDLEQADVISTALLVNQTGNPIALPAEITARSAWEMQKIKPFNGQEEGSELFWQGPTGLLYRASKTNIVGIASPWRWSLVTLTQVSFLEAPIEAITEQLKMIFLLALFATGGVLFVVSTQITQPLKRLTEIAATTERASDFKTFTLRTNDEVGVLGRSYNRMMGTLRSYEVDLEEKVAQRTHELNVKTTDIQNMLQNMRVGVFTIGKSMEIHHEYSQHLEVVFETTEIAGKKALDFLFATSDVGVDAIDLTSAVLMGALGEDIFTFELNCDNLLREFNIEVGEEKKIVEIDWNPVCDENDIVEKILVNVRDITQLKALEAEAGAKRQELQIIGEILDAGHEPFTNFMANASELLERAQEQTASFASLNSERIIVAFRNLHTIKGNARALGFTLFLDAAHIAEDGLSKLKTNIEESVLTEVRENMAKLTQLFGLYRDVYEQNLKTLGEARTGGSSSFDAKWVSALVDSLRHLSQKGDINSAQEALGVVEEAVAQASQITVGHVFESVTESIPSLAQELDKPAPNVHLEGEHIVIPKSAVSPLQNVLNHLIRNSLDHGLEHASEREKKGKSKEGQLHISARLEESRLLLSVHDDGRGLNLEKLRSKAATELQDEPSEKSDEEVADLVFRSGLSTAEEVTNTSGRGVGMDAIRAFARERGGDAIIEFRDENRLNESFRNFKTVVSFDFTESA